MYMIVVVVVTLLLFLLLAYCYKSLFHGLCANVTVCFYFRCLSQMEGLFLKSVIAEFRSSGLEEATFGDVSIKYLTLSVSVLPLGKGALHKICSLCLKPEMW